MSGSRKLPLLGVAVALCVGIVFGSSLLDGGSFSFSEPLFLLFVSLLVVGILVDIVFKKSLYFFYSLFALVGLLITLLSYPDKPTVPFNDRVGVVAVIESSAKEQRKWLSSQVKVIATRDSVRGWQEANFGAFLLVDTLSHSIQQTKNQPQVGDTITYHSRLRSVEGGYGDYLARRGVQGRFYIWNWDIIGRSDTSSTPFSQRIEELRERTAQRIYSIDSSALDATSIMSAMTIGVKDRLPYETVKDYRDAGVAHILAISGLHIGIVVVLLNMLFSSLKLWHRVGRIVFSIVVVLALWAYAVFAGMSPSVERAAIMFTLYQLATMLNRTGASLNVLSAAAIIILLIDPLSFFDIGFQLSFAAMIGISTLFRPLFLSLRPRGAILRGAWGTVCIALAAQLTVLPLSVFHFGTLPLMGLVFSILIWITVPLIISSTLLYLVSSLSFIGLVGLKTTELQNLIFGATSSAPWSVIEGLSMPLWLLILIYFLIFCFIAWFSAFSERRSRANIIKSTHRL